MAFNISFFLPSVKRKSERERDREREREREREKECVTCKDKSTF